MPSPIRMFPRLFDPPSVLSRREALRAALAAAGGLMSVELLGAAPAKSAGPRIAVIGAGFAGLACADELAAAGFRVTVFEARDRVGGRVVSFSDLVKNKIVEGGGELVGPNQPTWMAYAKRFGLKFVEMPWNPSDVVRLGDELLPPADATRFAKAARAALETLNKDAAAIDADRPWKSPRAAALDRQSLDDWIRRLDVEPRVKQLIEIQMTGINGLIPAWQSLLGILAIVKGGGLQKFWDETDTLHCVGGTQQLARLLAESLTRVAGASALQLNRAVHAIRANDQSVSLELSDGSTAEFDDVVLTVPPTTWNKIAFDPALPPQLSVPMAASTKYLAVFNAPIWKQLGRQPNAMSSGPIHVTWETTAGQGDAGEHALVAFAGGRAADECRGWTAEERDRRCQAALEKFFPGAKQAITGSRFVDWVSDPWARGTYSFPAPGQVTLVGPILDQPHAGRIHFAGEYACYAFVGWMEGALQSGVQVARKLARREGKAKGN